MMSEKLIHSVLNESIEVAANINPLFESRITAGRKLSSVLEKREYADPVLIAIPTGGIPIALAIKKEMGIPIILGATSKIQFPYDSRFGMGAITQSVTLLNDDLISFFSLDEEYVDHSIRKARIRMLKGIAVLQDCTRPLYDACGKTAVIVDDGLATGFTALAVAQTTEQACPNDIVILSPVASRDASVLIKKAGYELLALHQSESPGFLVENFYEDFPQLTVDGVKKMLNHQVSPD